MSPSEQESAPGDGPAAEADVSLCAGNTRAIRERVGTREFSAHVAPAVQRRIERDLSEEALQGDEAACGPIPRSLARRSLNRSGM